MTRDLTRRRAYYMHRRFRSNIYDWDDMYQDARLARLLGKRQQDEWAMIDSIRRFYGRKAPTIFSLDTSTEMARLWRQRSTSPADQDDFVLRAELRSHVRRAILRIKKPQRRLVMWLHFIEEELQADIAQRLGVNPSRISIVVTEGCQELRQRLRRCYDGH